MLDFSKDEHKEEWYCKMVPNGRIPMIVDHWNNEKVVWESNSVMKYIASRYDTEKRFLVTNSDEEVDMNTCTYQHLAWSIKRG